MNTSFRSTDKSVEIGRLPSKTGSTHPYGDGSNKIFGMENFGNTCYCNSILQCLYYSDRFRREVLAHNPQPHERRLLQPGTKVHGFTLKYEQLLNKKLKEHNIRPPPNAPANLNNAQGNNNNAIFTAEMATDDEKPKMARKGSLFGIKFNSLPSSAGSATTSEAHDTKYANCVVRAKDVESLPLEQKIRISKSADFLNLDVLVTRPSPASSSPTNRTDYSQSSSMLLGDTTNTAGSTEEGSVGPTSSAVIIGIPQPETFLSTPINPFNPNPSADHRKRSALINGPILNIDAALNTVEDDAVLLNALKDVFECMVENQSTTGVVSPTYFITKLKERNYLFRQNNMHHDAHEFFNYLINEIIESLGKDHNWCNDLFQGVITNETKCLLCETVTSKHENFLDLSIDIPPGESAYSLSYSLNNFSRLEVLTNRNKFYCNTCLSLQEATKTIKLAKLPEVLVINFKRFKYDEKVDKMVKLFDSISYPFKLRLFNTTDQYTSDSEDDDDETAPCSELFSLYELYALVIHIGGGPMHGHYVALCKVKAGIWLLFDDETVEMVEDSYVMRFFGDGPGLASAYILFYQKVHHANEDETNYGYSLDDIIKGHDCSYSVHGESSESLLRKVHTEMETSDQASTIPSAGSSAYTPAVVPTPVAAPVAAEQPSAPPPISRKGSIFKKNFNSDKKMWLLRKDGKEAMVEEKTLRNVSLGLTERPEPEKKRSLFGFKRKS